MSDEFIPHNDSATINGVRSNDPNVDFIGRCNLGTLPNEETKVLRILNWDILLVWGAKILNVVLTKWTQVTHVWQSFLSESC